MAVAYFQFRYLPDDQMKIRFLTFESEAQLRTAQAQNPSDTLWVFSLNPNFSGYRTELPLIKVYPNQKTQAELGELIKKESFKKSLENLWHVIDKEEYQGVDDLGDFLEAIELPEQEQELIKKYIGGSMREFFKAASLKSEFDLILVSDHITQELLEAVLNKNPWIDIGISKS